MGKAVEGGWYMAKSGSGLGRRYVYWYALMVMSKGLIVGTGSRLGVIMVIGTTGDEPSHWLVGDGRRSQSDLRQ